MRQLLSILAFGAFLALFSRELDAQTYPVQDCFGALPVCSNVTLVGNDSISGTGDIEDLLSNNYCFTVNPTSPNLESNSAWYIFTTANPGTMAFDITPNIATDDYDFILFNVTGFTCEDIIDGSLFPVRCDFSGTPGSTGLRNGYADTSAPNNGPTFLAPLTVSANETFILFINNYTSGGGGYGLDFSSGTTDVIDDIPPTVVGTDTLDCDTTSILTVYFSEPIVCSSILGDGSQFSITGPSTVTPVGAFSVNCVQGQFTNYISIIIDAPILQEGTYSITPQAGTGGMHLQDVCSNPADSTVSIQFDAPAIVLPHFGYTISASCIADTFNFVNTSNPSTTNGNPTWVWDFGDGSATSTLQDPKHTFPAEQPYTVTLTATTDDGCTYSGDSNVVVSNSYYADFSWSPLTVCPNVPIQFTDMSPGSSDSWYWNFDDNQISADHNPVHTFLQPGTYSVTFEISLTDPSGVCSDSVVIDVDVAEAVQANFTLDQSQICASIPVTFTDESSGNPTSLFWDFGNGDTSTQQNPTTTYIDTGSFDVIFIATNGCGDDTLVSTYSANALPVFDLGADTSVCFTDPIVLHAYSGADSYQWSTGSTADSLLVTEVPAEIRVTVINGGCQYEDRINLFELTDGCVIAPVPSAFTPNGDGLNDVFRLVSPDRIQSLEVWIYNRWGELVFHDNKIDFEWDGNYKREKADMGVYMYIIEGRGYSSDGALPFYRTGNLTLIR